MADSSEFIVVDTSAAVEVLVGAVECRASYVALFDRLHGAGLGLAYSDAIVPLTAAQRAANGRITPAQITDPVEARRHLHEVAGSISIGRAPRTSDYRALALQLGALRRRGLTRPRSAP